MTLEDVIKNKRLLDIDLSPKYELTYTGVCLKANKHLWVIVNFRKRKKEFDGYTIFRNNDISTFAIWKKGNLIIKNNNISQYIEKFPTKYINTFYSCFKRLLNKELIAFFVSGDIKSYYLGEIQSVDRNNVTVKTVDVKGNWGKTRTFRINDIIYFSFRTQYENKFYEKLKK